jgi:hypothetical protein
MDLIGMAREFPEMSVTIRLSDLLKANEALAMRVREEARREARAVYDDELVPKEEARKRLLGGVDPSTLWRWEKAGYLAPVRIGTKVYYRRGDIARLVDGKQER